MADEIHEQLKLNSPSVGADREIGQIVEAAIIPEKGEASSRTLELLDYERMKYQFFASMSNELQYEYTEDPPMAVLSDWADTKMGLPEVIKDPYEDEQMNSIFGAENLQSLRRALHSTTPEEPVIQMEFEATVEGEPRWFQITAHANWSADDPQVYLGSIGMSIMRRRPTFSAGPPMIPSRGC